MVYRINVNVSNKALVFLGLSGIVLVMGGAYLGFKVVPGIIIEKIWEAKVLKENTEQWNIFLETPFPYTFKIYVYDIQNPEEIFQGEKPIVKEVGPFVYRNYKWKSDIEWTRSDDISYNSYQRFEFDKEASGIYTEDTELTFLNIPYFALLLKTKKEQPEFFGLLQLALPGIFGKNNEIFIKAKVGDYLWKGLTFCKNGGATGGFAAAMACRKIIARLPESQNLRLENNTVLFAYLHYKNNTHLGRFTVKSGQKNKNETALLSLYNGKTHISTWYDKSSSCNKIRGVTSVFPVEIQRDMVFESYAEDICRHVELEYDSEETVKKVKGFKFVAKNNTFDNSLPENSCFCSGISKPLNEYMSCIKNGITDLSPCIGSPVMVSFPHLLYGDEEYLNSVEGMNPDKDKHQPFIILEPLSGLPLYANQKLQFNWMLKPIEGLDSTSNISKALLPLSWIEESIIIPDEYITKLDKMLFHTLFIVNIVKWVVIVSGGATALIACLTLIYRHSP